MINIDQCAITYFRRSVACCDTPEGYPQIRESYRISGGVSDPKAQVSRIVEHYFRRSEAGTGKTTLAENLTVFLGAKYTKTMPFADDEVTATGLTSALDAFVKDFPANEQRVVPINIDHREARPATATEVSEIKRFLRQGAGQRALIVWPGTDPKIAHEMSQAYRQVAGVVPLEIPIRVSGPLIDSWAHLAAQTLQLTNQVDSLEHLVDLDAGPRQSRDVGRVAG